MELQKNNEWYPSRVRYFRICGSILCGIGVIAFYLVLNRKVTLDNNFIALAVCAIFVGGPIRLMGVSKSASSFLARLVGPIVCAVLFAIVIGIVSCTPWQSILVAAIVIAAILVAIASVFFDIRNTIAEKEKS